MSKITEAMVEAYKDAYNKYSGPVSRELNIAHALSAALSAGQAQPDELWENFQSRRFLHGHRETPKESFSIVFSALVPPAVPGEVEETWRCDECDCRSYALIDKKLPNGTYAPGNDKRCVHCKKVHLAKLADALPSGHVVLEQADMPDGRVSQTVRGRDGIEYERIVHGDEAYGEDE